jgi:hypothetical protein
MGVGAQRRALLLQTASSASSAPELRAKARGWTPDSYENPRDSKLMISFLSRVLYFRIQSYYPDSVYLQL